MKLRFVFLITLAFVCLYSFAEEHPSPKPIAVLDLNREGLPADYFRDYDYKHCPYQFFEYRTVLWLDANRILVGFSSSPTCSMDSQLMKGTLNLVIFDKQGAVLSRTTLPYDAGDGNGIRVGNNGDIWAGPMTELSFKYMART
jgi:hypothetical protein